MISKNLLRRIIARHQKSAADKLNGTKQPNFKAQGKLVAAQPTVRKGFIVSKNEDGWANTAVDPTKEVQVGYYHIMANDLDEAIAMAKDNPEFEYVPSASIEVRPVKMKEQTTGFVYST